MPYACLYKGVNGVAFMSLGKNIHRMRKEKEWTQQDLATATGIKLGHISKLENDEGDPKLSTIVKLMNALGCSPNELMGSETKGISNTLKRYLEMAMHMPAMDKYILLQVIERFIQAEQMRTVQLAKMPEEMWEEINEEMKIMEVERSKELHNEAAEEALKEEQDHEWLWAKKQELRR